MYDIIGDIHGHAEPLKKLLLRMGYEKNGKGYKHSERKVLFLGDYIDRGPQILETLEIVRSMHENEDAIALMGNHEYNALCYNSPDGKGDYLRPRTPKNTHQHSATLLAFKDDIEAYQNYLEWFKTLDLFYENEHFRAVHACWDDRMIDVLRAEVTSNKLTTEFVARSADKEHRLFAAVDQTLKGVELTLPDGFSYEDHEKNTRKEIRVKWWEHPKNFTYNTYTVTPWEKPLPDLPVQSADCKFSIYPDNAIPVFFGHYWLTGEPELLRSNVCCLDYSVAKKGMLVAYRHDGESVLNPEKFIYEPA